MFYTFTNLIHVCRFLYTFANLTPAQLDAAGGGSLLNNDIFRILQDCNRKKIKIPLEYQESDFPNPIECYWEKMKILKDFIIRVAPADIDILHTWRMGRIL